MGLYALTVYLFLFGRACHAVRHDGGAGAAIGAGSAAAGLRRADLRRRHGPGIVIGIATLIALVTVFDWINPLLASIWPVRTQHRSCRWGVGSLIAAHTLFTMALVIIIVRARMAGMDRSLIEASADLWRDALGHVPARSRCR
jgi:hypothetical protein